MKKLLFLLLLWSTLTLIGCGSKVPDPNLALKNSEDLVANVNGDIRPFAEIMNSKQQEILEYLNKYFSIQNAITKTSNGKVSVEVDHPTFWKVELTFKSNSVENNKDFDLNAEFDLEMKLKNVDKLHIGEMSDMLIKSKIDFDVIVKGDEVFFKLKKGELSGVEKTQFALFQNFLKQFTKNKWLKDDNKLIGLSFNDTVSKGLALQQLFVKHLNFKFIESDGKLINENWRKYYKLSLNKEVLVNQIADFVSEMQKLSSDNPALAYTIVNNNTDDLKEGIKNALKQNLNIDKFNGELYLNKKGQEEITINTTIKPSKDVSIDVDVLNNKEDTKIFVTYKEKQGDKDNTINMSFEKYGENYKILVKSAIAEFVLNGTTKEKLDKESLETENKMNLEFKKPTEEFSNFKAKLDIDNSTKVWKVKDIQAPKTNLQLSNELKKLDAMFQ